MYDLLKIRNGIIAHQVNCKKKMGAGIAKAIKEKYPKVYNEYINKKIKLGDVQLLEIDEDFYVANVAGQYDYKGKNNTDYETVESAFKQLSFFAKANDFNVYIPFMMGCGLGGGDWRKYRKIIDKHLGNKAKICCKELENSTVYTSYFGNIKNTVNPVSIAYKSVDKSIPEIDEFKPSAKLLRDYKNGVINKKQYTQEFFDGLENINISSVLEKLLEKMDKNKRITLVCYEKSGFCHRHLVAQWLEYFYGLKVTEK